MLNRGMHITQYEANLIHIMQFLLEKIKNKKCNVPGTGNGDKLIK